MMIMMIIEQSMLTIIAMMMLSIEKVEVCKEIMGVAQQRKFADLHYV